MQNTIEGLAIIFPNDTEFLQGEILPQILFSIYINDIEINFIKENCPCVDFQPSNIIKKSFILWF